LCLLALRAAGAQDSWDLSALDTARGAGYLSAEEKDLVLEINKLRSDPPRYAELVLAPRRASFSGRLYKRPGRVDIMTHEGVRALDECLAELRRSRPRGLLLASQGMSRAAADHAEDQARTGATGHTGSDGSSADSRMERYGEWLERAGENISYGSDEPAEILFQLLVDDGVPGRGHRANLMQPGFRSIGVAIGPHPRLRAMCVMDFAGGFRDKGR
jgi:hypothetical protein